MTIAVRPDRGVLGMYPFASTRPGYDLLWEHVHRRLPWTVQRLSWTDEPHSSWYDPLLCFGQACGWPLVTELRGLVRVIGTFEPAIPQATGHRYQSVLVARAEGGRVPDLLDLAGRRAAVNSPRSLSGWVSLIHAVHGPGAAWQGEVLWTGAHAASLAAVREGRADVASIDSVTLAVLRREDPHAVDGVVEVGVGPMVPALPLITRCTADEEVTMLREAIAAAVADDPRIGSSILARGFAALDASDYEPVLAVGPVTAGGDRPG